MATTRSSFGKTLQEIVIQKHFLAQISILEERKKQANTCTCSVIILSVSNVGHTDFIYG